MSTNRGTSLGVKITLALLSLALVPLVVTTLLLAGFNSTELRQRALDFRLAIADDASRMVLNFVDRAQGELLTVGQLLARSEVSEDTRVQVAQATMLGARFVDQVAIYDPAGELVDTLQVNETPNGLTRPDSLDEALRGVARSEGLAALGVEFPAPDHPRLPLLVPILKANDRLYGYLWTDIGLGPLSKEVARLSARRFGDGSDQVYLLDERLRVLAHSRPSWLSRSLVGKGPAAELADGGNHLRRDVVHYPEYEAAGKRMLGLVAPIPELGWGVVVEQPAAVVLSAVRRTWFVGSAVGAGFGLAAILLGLLIGRRLASPVKAVAQAASEVAKGDFGVRVSVRSKDEVGQLAGAFNSMAGDLEEYERRVVEEARIRGDLSRYLNAELVDGIVEKRLELELGGQRQDASILFADVVGFTQLAEQHDPEFVVSILNELFTFVTEIVFRNGGIIDKFIGDAVMAVFGVPVAQPDHAIRALQAAEEMQRWLEIGNAKWRKDLGRDLQMSIGINSGTVLAGNIGSTKRMEYTVIGDVVNVAARLESLAQPGQILVSEQTALKTQDSFLLDKVGTQTLTGRKQETGIFSLVE